MSYTEHYSASIHYSGSVSYPASENGGSVSYSGSVPVSIAVHVDTDDFDKSVRNCNTSIHGLTAAVIATEAAQVAAKKSASEKIADTIIRGFFNYVGADLAQKISELSAKCEAMLMELMDQKQTCMTKTSQMQNDYEMISRRYAKIFEDLDKETVSRIEQLDKPAFQFADMSQEVVDRGCNSDLLGIATISANENLQLEALLSCSHVKLQARDLIAGAEEYLKGTYKLTNAVSHMLTEETQEHDIHLPVIYVESVNQDSHNVASIYRAESGFSPSGEPIESNLRSKFMSENVQWEDMPSDCRERTMPYFNSLLQEDHLDDRIRNTIISLMESDNIQTIK